MGINWRGVLAILLTAAVLISVSGCTRPRPSLEEPDYTALPILSSVTHTDFDGIELSVSGIYVYENRTEILVVWNNTTAYCVTYGTDYVIERLENNAWVSCAKTDELYFAEIAYELEPERLCNRTYDLTDFFKVSEPGTYRFKTDCSVYIDPEESAQCTLWAEFVVVENTSFS